MTGAVTKMAEHHRRIEMHFAAARRSIDERNWDGLTACVAQLRDTLLSHLRHEEERIFPLYEESSGEEGATEWLRAQHDDMRAVLWTLATIQATDEPERYCAEFRSLQMLFDAHAAEEERRMYPVFERMLGIAVPRA